MCHFLIAPIKAAKSRPAPEKAGRLRFFGKETAVKGEWDKRRLCYPRKDSAGSCSRRVGGKADKIRR